MKNVEEQIMQKKDMIVPSMYEIIEINRKLGYKPVKEGALDFILLTFGQITQALNS